MKVGDLVLTKWVTPSDQASDEQIGMVVYVDRSHRQTVVDVLWPKGLEKKVWDRHLEVVYSEEG